MRQRDRVVVAIIAIALLLNVAIPRKQSVNVSSRPNLVQVIQRVNPSVVYIEAYGNYNAYDSDEYGFDKMGNGKLWSGSGVIIFEDGLVLTAAHVVDGADRFKVTLPDGREFWSENAWHRSEISDVGFIQLDIITTLPADVSQKLPVSYLGKSDNLRKGQDIFIVGCPFGHILRFTVTKGIVSGFYRDFDGFFGEKMLMQVDAASYPGNSGGPIYNMQGRIIGILVGGYSGGYDNIGLCIPVDIISGILRIYEAEQTIEKME